MSFLTNVDFQIGPVKTIVRFKKYITLKKRSKGT